MSGFLRNILYIFIIFVIIFLFYAYGSKNEEYEYTKILREIDYICYVELDGISWEWNGCYPDCELKNGDIETMYKFHRPFE